jgi:hypothetical protein
LASTAEAPAADSAAACAVSLRSARFSADSIGVVPLLVPLPPLVKLRRLRPARLLRGVLALLLPLPLPLDGDTCDAAAVASITVHSPLLPTLCFFRSRRSGCLSDLLLLSDTVGASFAAVTAAGAASVTATVGGTAGAEFVGVSVSFVGAALIVVAMGGDEAGTDATTTTGGPVVTAACLSSDTLKLTSLGLAAVSDLSAAFCGCCGWNRCSVRALEGLVSLCCVPMAPPPPTELCMDSDDDEEDAPMRVALGTEIWRGLLNEEEDEEGRPEAVASLAASVTAPPGALAEETESSDTRRDCAADDPRVVDAEECTCDAAEFGSLAPEPVCDTPLLPPDCTVSPLPPRAPPKPPRVMPEPRLPLPPLPAVLLVVVLPLSLASPTSVSASLSDTSAEAVAAAAAASSASFFFSSAS